MNNTNTNKVTKTNTQGVTMNNEGLTMNEIQSKIAFLKNLKSLIVDLNGVDKNREGYRYKYQDFKNKKKKRRRERRREVGRRGGEMRRRGRGIIVGGIALLLMLGCNNGGEDPQKVFLKSVVSLGNDFLNVFTSFGDVFNSSLGFKKDLKKSDVRDYFKNVHEKVEGTKTALNKIVADMKSENNPNAEATDVAVKKLVSETLEKIIKGAKTVSEAIGEASESLGNVAPAGGSGAGGSKGDDVDGLVNGIKLIVDIVLKNIGNADAGDDKKASDGAQRGNDAGEAGKLFGNDDTGAAANSKQAAGDVAKAIGAVTGADILQAIAKGADGESAKLAKHNGLANTITSTSGVAQHAKDGTIAGGIVLRAMAKNGKFANGSGGNDVKEGIKNAAISAVTKALDTLTMAIRKTIDEGFKEVKKAMNINTNDNPVISEANTANNK